MVKIIKFAFESILSHAYIILSFLQKSKLMMYMWNNLKLINAKDKHSTKTILNTYFEYLIIFPLPLKKHF